MTNEWKPASFVLYPEWYNSIRIEDNISEEGWTKDIIIEFKGTKQMITSWGYFRLIGNKNSVVDLYFDPKPFILRLPTHGEFYVEHLRATETDRSVFWNIIQAEIIKEKRL